MPMGNYKDFAECMLDQTKKGHNKESASKICGSIKAKTEDKESIKDWKVLEYYVPIITEKIKDDDSFYIEGTAINETITRNNVKYVAEELRNASSGLTGKPILKDHKNEVDAIVGRVKNSYFDESSRSIKFRGQIMDEKIKEMINDGRIQHVSIGAKVKNLRKSESADENCVIAEGLEILELSLTPVPGDASATLNQAYALSESYNLLEAEKSYKCDECNKVFSSAEELAVHEEKAHESKEKPNDESKEDKKKYKEDKNMSEEILKENEKLKAQLSQLEAEKTARDVAEHAELAKEYAILCDQMKIAKADTTKMAKETLRAVVDTLKIKNNISESTTKGIAKEETSITKNNWDGYCTNMENGKVKEFFKVWYKRN